MKFFKLLTALILISNSFFANAQYRFADSSSLLHTNALGLRSMDIKAADFNGDQIPDIVMAIEWLNNRILFGHPNGHFYDSTAGRLAIRNHDSEDIGIADLDGNGWLDIIFVSEDDTTHEFYLNTGFGNFSDVSTRLPKSEANSIAILDLNADSKQDLIIAGKGPYKVYINDGSGFFSDESNRFPLLNDTTQDLLLIDIDKDLDLDIIAANENKNRIFINNGSGFFTDESNSRLPQNISMESRKVSAADIDMDGDQDLFFSNVAFLGKNPLDRLYRNNGSGVFTEITGSNMPADMANTLDAVFTDLNKDNFPDLVVAYMPNLMPGIYLNDGLGTFTDHSSMLPSSANGSGITVLVYDFNKDDRPDLFFGNFGTQDKMFYHIPVGSGTQELKNLFNFRVYPNPSCKILQLISENNLPDKLTACFYDLQGKAVSKIKECSMMNNESKIEIPSLKNGIYILEINSKQDRVFRGKIQIDCK